MSKLFYRLDSLIRYLKHNDLLSDSYEPFILKTDEDKKPCFEELTQLNI